MITYATLRLPCRFCCLSMFRYFDPARQPQIQVQTTICSYCGQAIPIDEITEHIRIELLDPKWKERKQELDARKTQAGMLQKGTFIA